MAVPRSPLRAANERDILLLFALPMHFGLERLLDRVAARQAANMG
jgi:hypothetical protein